MALDTYDHLSAAILDWLMRPGDTTYVGPAIPDLIILAEEELRDRLKTRFNETTTTLAVTGGVNTVALPAYFESARDIVLVGASGDSDQVLTEMEPEQMDAMYPAFVGVVNEDPDTEGPLFYAIVGTNLRLAPFPSTNGTLRMTYMQGIPALSEAAPVNWLLTDYPSCYLFGSLAEAGDYIGDDARLTKHERRRDAAIARIMLADRKARWSGSQLTIRTDTGNP